MALILNFDTFIPFTGFQDRFVFRAQILIDSSFTTAPKVIYKFKHKFEPKVKYIAKSDKWISKAWSKPSGLAIYLRVNLQKKN